MTTPHNFYYRSSAFIITLIGIITVLIVAQQFLIPLCIGALFAFTLYPLTSKLESFGISRIVANIIGLISALLIILSVGIIVSWLFSNFINDLPIMREHMMQNFVSVGTWIESRFYIPLDTQLSWIERYGDISSLLGKHATTIFSTTKTTVAMTGLTFVYAFFFLYYRTKFVHILHKVLPENKWNTFENALKKTGTIVPHYLLGILIVVGILAVINSVGFLLVGVHNAIFFGVVAAILNIIPYLGPVIGFLIVFIVTLATQNISTALGVFGVFIVIQFLENNILTPGITAGRVKINPFVALLSVILGGLFWGIPGMLISIPIVGMIKVVCEYIPSLTPLAYALNTETGIPESKPWYMRLYHVFIK